MKNVFTRAEHAPEAAVEPATEPAPVPDAEPATEPIRRFDAGLPPAHRTDDDAVVPGEGLPPAGPEGELPVEDEPFVPRSRYVMGRSTKVLVCVALVAGGMFAGSAVQKQIDAGTRAQRGTFGTFQNSGAGNGSGATTPGQGQGRRGGTAGGGATGAPTAGSTAAPSGSK